MATPKVVVALATFVCQVEGHEVFVAAGERWPAGHPVVKAHPEAFSPEASAGVRS